MLIAYIAVGWAIYAVNLVTGKQYQKSENMSFEINALGACLAGFCH